MFLHIFHWTYMLQIQHTNITTKNHIPAQCAVKNHSPWVYWCCNKCDLFSEQDDCRYVQMVVFVKWYERCGFDSMYLKLILAFLKNALYEYSDSGRRCKNEWNQWKMLAILTPTNSFCCARVTKNRISTKMLEHFSKTFASFQWKLKV